MNWVEEEEPAPSFMDNYHVLMRELGLSGRPDEVVPAA